VATCSGSSPPSLPGEGEGEGDGLPAMQGGRVRVRAPGGGDRYEGTVTAVMATRRYHSNNVSHHAQLPYPLAVPLCHFNGFVQSGRS
jgi:hypothetical protein